MLLTNVYNTDKTMLTNLHKIYARTYMLTDWIWVSLESLALRRLHCGVIMLFKILHGITICDIKNAFVLNPVNVTRGHSYKLKKEFCKLDVRNFFLLLVS